jgi:uncharacterized integral membrane protein
MNRRQRITTMIDTYSTRKAAAAIALGVCVAFWAAAQAIAAEESTAASRTADGAPASIAALTQVPDEVIDAANAAPNSAGTGDSHAGSSASPALPPDLDVPGTDASDDPNVEVEPRVTYTPELPPWVREGDHREGANFVAVVTSGPQLNFTDCQRSIDENAQLALNEYIDDYLGVEGASRLVSCDLETIREHMIDPDPNYQYNGTAQFDWGSMYVTYRRLLVDQDFRDDLDTRWRVERRKARLLQTVLFGGGAMAVLALVFGFFSIDTATRGYYTGRLRLAALTAILAVIVAGVLVARFVPWL